MSTTATAPLYLALIHYPAINRCGEIITATIEYFDVFDISRLSLTYPVAKFFCVNPLPSQQEFARHLLSHGGVRERDVKRKRVFSKTEALPDIFAVIEAVTSETGHKPLIVATSAKQSPNTITFGQTRRFLADQQPLVLMFGKAWGMPRDFIDATADHILEPIDSGTGYNHLSVRSAVSIIVDRIFRS